MNARTNPIGTWDLQIATPLGQIDVALVIRETPDGLAGTADGSGHVVELEDLRLNGQRLTWQQRVRRPLRLDLEFDVTIEGDGMTGHSRAGRLPRSQVRGRRVRTGAAS